MSVSEPTLETVRAYLLAQANSALRRPGMHGGEVAVRLYLDAVAVACGTEQAWAADMDNLRERGGSNGVGVTGALATVLGDGTEDAMASVYADLAYSRNWLHLDHRLPPDDYNAMRDGIAATCRTGASWSHLRERFGEPSILFGGTSPHYPKTLGYASDRPQDPLICFHLWNDLGIHPEPVLVAVRRAHPSAAFRDAFTFASVRRP
ncbi:hypothetical protein F5972_06350 [Microbispora cellulosiformans]|uniref:Uncharacterized protein n=1 Tax=Microbispora cellulosiformans TaxID=2614688 RepID=A0A5J5KAT8_9ACTN|nr:hypothetical protein [Microbispora cellulosiformans]KAA9380728.1 hypothetical protein F5972_06350 [Microbispora cellulosiformans]